MSGDRRSHDEGGEDRASRRGLPGSPTAAATGSLRGANNDGVLPGAEARKLARDVHGAGNAVVAVDQPTGFVDHASRRGVAASSGDATL